MTAPHVPLPLDPASFQPAIRSAAEAAGFTVHDYGEVAGIPLQALSRVSASSSTAIYLSGGIHGDEPSGPLALLDMLRRGVFDDRASWYICPLLNPIGFIRRTRENAEGIDLNRDYHACRSAEIRAHARWLTQMPRVELALCLHEDWEVDGFYLYELNPTGRTSLAPRMLEAVTAVCPIESAHIIDGHDISETGIIRPVNDAELRDLWPEALYLRAHHTDLTYTLETPSSRPIEQRVAAHVAAVTAGIDALFA